MEDEQQGDCRAAYGKAVLKDLSERLTKRFGDGWSYSNLRQVRQFYLVYSNLTDTVCQIQPESRKRCLRNSNDSDGAVQAAAQTHTPQFSLSWSHYLILMRIANPQERSFYEIECKEQNWSVRQLQRQCASSLYERLALSRDKDKVMQLARQGQTVEKAEDVIKAPPDAGVPRPQT